MKATSKRIICGLLVVALAAGMFALAPASEARAASLYYNKKVTLYLQDKTGKSSGYVYDSIFIDEPGQPIKLSSLKSSKSSVVEVTGVDNDDDCSFIDFKAKKPGTAKITFKVGSKTYSSTVTVKNYKNPVKTVKISGIKKGQNIAGKSKNKNYIDNLKLSKTTKKAKLKVKAASGWELYMVNFYDNTNGKQIVDKFYSNGTTKQKTYSLGTLKKSHMYSVFLGFENKKNGCAQDLSYDINF